MNRLFNKIQIQAAFIFLLFISISCVSTRNILIEVPQKSKNELPENIQSLLLVARMVDGSYQDYNTDSLQRIFYNKNFSYDTIINDLQAVDTTLKALGELLFESGRYDFVIPENRFIPFEKNSFLTLEMPWDEVKTLCENYNTDAILSLDHFITRVSTEFGKDYFFDPYSDGFRNASVAKMNVFYEALFRIYDPRQQKVLVREFFRDTLYWEDVDISTGELFKNFTPVKKALTESGIALALDFSDKVSTVWREEQRSIFVNGDKVLANAAQFAGTNQWEPAMALWLEIDEKGKSKTVKSKAEFNLAVAYELQGDIDNAISWALKSYETMFRTITYDYLEILKRRKNEIIKQ